jgi:hypothetical protein
MTTPGTPLEERVTILETRFDTILPTLATKEDIARLEGKMDAMNERLGGKIEALGERLGGEIEATNRRLGGKIEALGERLGGEIEATNRRLEGKIDAMGNRLLIRFTGVMAALVAIAVAAARFL